jgi:hypothetical protein
VNRRNIAGAAAAYRFLRIARHLYEGGILSVRWVMCEFGVCETCAKKDLRLVQEFLPVERIKPPRGIAGQTKVLRLITKVYS